MMQKEQSVRRWFSLIELLFMIAIIAVLISLLLPALKKARDSASAIVCIGNVRSYGFKYMEFIDTNGGVFSQMVNKLEKDYFLPSDDPKAHACPLDDVVRKPNAIWGANPLLPVSYAINGHLVGWVKLDPQTGFMSWVGLERDYVPLKIQQIRFASRTVLFGEYTCNDGSVWTPNPQSSTKIKYHLKSLFPSRYIPPYMASGGANPEWVKYDHRMGHNFSFLDGSARYMTYGGMLGGGFASWHKDGYNLKCYAPYDQK